MRTKNEIAVKQKMTFRIAMDSARAVLQSCGVNSSEILQPFAHALDCCKFIASEMDPGDSMTHPHRIVLHESHKTGEWVTHIQNCVNESFDSGHYFDTFDRALIDYIARCNDYNLKTLLHDQFILHTN